ncbi:MAG: hypothetical protein AB8C84_12500 [Oligoflexales bacterium]
MSLKDSKDVEIVAELLSRYASVAVKQLAGIQSHMTSLCDEVMVGVKGIHEKHGQKEKLASSLQVKDEGGGFSDQDAAKVIEKEKASEQELQATMNQFSDEAKDAGVQFKMHMNGLHDLSSGLQDALMKMVGAMSMDDVLGQRLEHISDSIVLLRDYVQKMSECSDKEKVFEDATLSMRSQVFRSYTTEDEKQVYRQVFPDES